MFAAKKIITSKQMKTFRAKNSSVMKGLLDKGADTIMRRKVTQNEFWKALRQESKSHEFGDKGYSKKGLTKFLGGLLENKGDCLTDRKVKRLADIMDIKRSKVFRAAAEVRAEQNKVKIQERQIEAQKHQHQRAGTTSYINEIISKGHEKARDSFHATSMVTKNGDITHADNYHSTEQGNNDIHENAAVNLRVSDNNIRKYENSVMASHTNHPSENHSHTFGHLMYLKNKQHDYVGEEDEIEDAKARLARIQGKANNHDNDIVNKIVA